MTKKPLLSETKLPFVAVIAFIAIATTNPTLGQYTVDYEFAPGRWMTPIGLVDDWQKSMVDHNGRLVYDFGPGPYAQPITTVGFTLDNVDFGETSQRLLDARIPIVLSTQKSVEVGNAAALNTAAFALIPDQPQQPSAESSDGAYRRLQGLVGSPAWAPLSEEYDAAFQSVAWGTGRSIPYDIRVTPGASKRIALGFLEVYRTGRISREMDLIVEGSPRRTVDIVGRGGQNVPQALFFDATDADSDGWIEVEVTGSPTGQDPNTFLNGIWVFSPDATATEADVIDGTARRSAELVVNAGHDLLNAGFVRTDALRATRSGTNQPLKLVINTRRQLTFDGPTNTILFHGSPFIVTSHPFALTNTETGWELIFPTTADAIDAIVIHGRIDGTFSLPDLAEEQQKSARYWQRVELPWNRISVPDAQIQDLLDGGIRTLYQVREIVDGYAQFQPGASVYRGLWYGDGVWGAETASLLDDADAARQVLDAMLLHQSADGRTGVLKPALLHRETAHLIYGIARYAELHQDWEWLDERWEQYTRAVQFLIDLRASASTDPEAVYFGLYPPGLTDGGVGGVGASYGSVYWGLIGIHEAARVARLLDKPEAAAWEAEFNDFLKAFRRATDRDTRQDEFGNSYVPVKMDFDPEVNIGQRGQWGVIHMLYAGQFLNSQDPLVTGTLAMLHAHTEEDHVVSLGWLTNGVWPIFEAHRALAYNWIGDPDKAELLLYSFANHATPTLLWAEEQHPKARSKRIAGDVPHTVGNMQIVRLVRFLLMLERDGNLELFGGLPLTWIHGGARLSALSLPTLYGPATVQYAIDSSGESASITVQTPKPSIDAGVVRLDTRRFQAAGFGLLADGSPVPDHLELPWGSVTHLVFRSK